MRAKTRTNQGGSVVTFLIVGTLLAAGLGGGIYYLSTQQGDGTNQVAQAPEDDEQTEVQTEPMPENGEESQPENGNPFNLNENEDDKKPSETNEKPADKPAEKSAPAAPANPTTPPNSTAPAAPTAPEKMATTGYDGSSQTTEPAAPVAPGTPELPQTGPTEQLIGALALAVVTFVAIIFRRSRSELASEIKQ